MPRRPPLPLLAGLCAVGMAAALIGITQTRDSTVSSAADEVVRTAIVAPSVALYTDPSAREPMNGPTPEPATLIYSAADAIGCTALVLDDIAAGYTSTTASCLLDGERVRLYEFPTAQAYSSFISELNRAGIQGLGLIRRGPVVFAPGPGDARAAVRAALEETAATH